MVSMSSTELDAERAVLGIALRDNSTIPDILDKVISPYAFSAAANQTLYSAIIELYNKGQAVDIVTISQHLSDKGSLKDVGGRTYIASLTDDFPSTVALPSYLSIITEQSTLRSLHALGTDTIALCVEKKPVETIIDFIGTKLLQAANSTSSEGLRPIGGHLDGLVKSVNDGYSKHGDRVDTGFGRLDDLIGGIQNGDLVIIAGRPSMGKTSLALRIAESMCFGGIGTVCFFSIEMTAASLVERMVFGYAHVSPNDMRSGRTNQFDVDKVCRAAVKFSGADFMIDESPILLPIEIRSRMKREAVRRKIGAIFVDYLQLMSLPEFKDGRVREIAVITGQLKAIAKELQVPVFVLSQLNRATELRTDKRPILADLRESGAIEQDADIVMMVHREGYYIYGKDRDNPENKDKLGKAEIIVAKHRNGATGSVEVAWLPDYSRFENIDYRSRF